MQRLFLFEPIDDRLDHDARNAHDQNNHQDKCEFFHCLFLDLRQSGHTGQQTQDPSQKRTGSNHQPVDLTDNRTGPDRSNSRLSHRLDGANAGGLPPKLPISHL